MVVFYKGDINVLELRVSGTAIANAPCGLSTTNIHSWLWETGNSFIKEINDNGITLMIKSYDISDKKLVTTWEKLRKAV
ncbi:hypothetical protein [Bacillus sp. UNCCL81]|uniref:hypothetical protein n=1 Tax=Bacillus sp. UNCCL81 TaxID=1502755 RepID=UPI0008E2FE53|nr:hypothetical protein [Bacillus sp. UNCCL81]SFC52624.1 hypothetical protein SAMN02799633_01095 [Bacillus sp. UNCCL81]